MSFVQRSLEAFSPLCEERATLLGLYIESDGPFYPQVRRDCLDDLSHTGCAHGKDRLGGVLRAHLGDLVCPRVLVAPYKTHI